MKRLITVILLIGCALHAQAQQALSLDSCRAMAQRHHLAVQQARIGVEQARLTKDAALSKYFPTLTANAGYFHSLTPIIDISTAESHADVDATIHYNGASVSGSTLEDIIREEFGNLVDNLSVDVHIKALDHGAFAGLMLTQPIFAGGRIINGNKLAQLGIDVAEVQLAMSEDEVTLNAESAYFQLLALQAKEGTLLQALCFVDTLLRDASAAHAAGVIGKNDLLKVRLKRSELLAQQTQLNNGIVLASLALRQLVGLPISDTMPLLLDTSALLAPTLSLAMPNVERRKEVALLDAAVRAEELKLSMLIGEGAPQIALTATYGMSSLFGDQFKRNGMALLSVSLPITGRWENYRNYQQQRLSLEAARLQRDDLKEKMELQNRQICNQLSEAYALLAIKNQAVSDAQENLLEMRSYYHAGLATTSDYLEAQTLLQQAQNERIDQAIAFRQALTRYQQISQVTQL